MSLKPLYFGHPFHAAWQGHPPQGYPHGHDQGFCAGCCHPAATCSCHAWQCRKEAKELTVMPGSGKADVLVRDQQKFANYMRSVMIDTTKGDTTKGDTADTAAEKLDHANAFIGGGCCVHLSVEYMRAHPNIDEPSSVTLLVVDGNGTAMAWMVLGKEMKETGYQIKQGVISTNPGANLTVLALNACVRVRWCEVFSC